MLSERRNQSCLLSSFTQPVRNRSGRTGVQEIFVCAWDEFFCKRQALRKVSRPSEGRTRSGVGPRMRSPGGDRACEAVDRRPHRASF